MPVRTEGLGPYTPDDIATFYARGDWQDRVLYDIAKDAAAAHPDRVYVSDGVRTITYGDLREQAVRLATGLRALGVGAGDRVAVQMPNWAEFAVITVALSRLGAVLVPIMAIFRHDEVGYILDHARARILIGPERFHTTDHAAMYRELREHTESLETIVLVRPEAAASDVVDFATLQAPGDVEALDEALGAHAGPDDGCLIVYTSGTTSRPKGCFHTFNTLHSSAIAMIRELGVTSDDVFFNPSPVCHSTGLVTGLLMPLIAGSGTHFMPRWDPAEGARRIHEYRTTITYTSTTFLTTLMDAYVAGEHDVSSMRYWVCAGAPIPGSVVQHARAMFDGLSVLSLYGRSENLATTMCGPEDAPERSVLSDGKALPGAAIRVVGADGLELPYGEAGDIAYRGPSHMLGYYNDTVETEALWTPDGFSRSGDLGVMDRDGFVRVNGRIKDIIIRGGINISSREVEDMVLEHPAVKDAALVAMPDARLGERACVFVIVAPGQDAPTLSDLTDFLRTKQIAVQKLPERLEIMDAFPMTAVGKVRKNVLRDRVAELLRQESSSSVG